MVGDLASQGRLGRGLSDLLDPVTCHVNKVRSPAMNHELNGETGQLMVLL